MPLDADTRDRLAKLYEAHRRAVELTKITDELVVSLLLGGAGYTRVGEALGISKQAAHARYKDRW